ncbi:MAG: hypothetical protein KDC18_14230 [Alphaproteobacteria bacterium]|nr:hypothetical protein [Alphaproteobacteria bacterium]MCB9931456.1 hypothetical protein [Alphaproteobacteria bacterium]
MADDILKIAGFATREAAERERRIWQREHPDVRIEEEAASDPRGRIKSFTLYVHRSQAPTATDAAGQSRQGTGPGRSKPVEDRLLDLITHLVSPYDWDHCEPPLSGPAVTLLTVEQLLTAIHEQYPEDQAVQAGGFGLRRLHLEATTRKDGRPEWQHRRFDRSGQIAIAEYYVATVWSEVNGEPDAFLGRLASFWPGLAASPETETAIAAWAKAHPLRR